MVVQLARQRGNRSESLPPLSRRFSQSIFRSSFLSRLREGASAHAGGVGTPYLFHLPSGGVSRFVYPSSTELPWIGRRGLARMRNERVIVQLLSFGGSFGSVWPFQLYPHPRSNSNGRFVVRRFSFARTSTCVSWGAAAESARVPFLPFPHPEHFFSKRRRTSF